MTNVRGERAGGGRRMLSMIGVVLAMLGLVAAGAGPAWASAGPVRLGVPAYWSASDPAGAAAFDRLLAAAPTVDTVVVNGPDSGPADPLDPALADAVRRLSRAGVTVLGYVDTGYLGRTGAATTRVGRGSTAVEDWQAQAAADSAAWQRIYSRYGLSGLFYDQTLSACGVDGGSGREYVAAYGAIAAQVRRRDADAVVAVNPGTSVQECYTEVADIVVIAENTFAAYRDWTPPAWVREHPRTTFWHLVHGADTPERMSEAMALARERHAGLVYVTDAVIDGTGGPWNRLPAGDYWQAEVAAARAARVRCPWR